MNSKYPEYILIFQPKMSWKILQSMILLKISNGFERVEIKEITNLYLIEE